MSLLNPTLGLILLVVLPILIGAMSNCDSIQRDLSSHHFKNVMTLHPPTGHQVIPGDDHQKTVLMKCDNAKLQRSPPPFWLPYKMRLQWLFWGTIYFSGYCLIFVSIWPTLMLTPFIFGLGLMCELDPGLEMEWSYHRLCRYWAWFMAVKVSK